MRKIIEEKTKNIGSLCSFLKNPINSEYLNYLNNSLSKSVLDLNLSMSEKIYYFINQIKEPRLCLCESKAKFIGFKNGYRKTCGSKECAVKSRKKTCITKYGVDNPKKSKKIIELEQENIKKRWNGRHYMVESEVRDKFNSTMKDKYGVSWAQQSRKISDKSVETFSNNPDREKIINIRSESFKNKSLQEKKEIERKKKETIESNFGDYGLFIDYRKDKIKEASIKKWGVDHHFKSGEIINKRIESYKKNKINNIIESLPSDISFIKKYYNKNNTDSIFKLNCSKCNEKFDINRQLMGFRLASKNDICLNCNPISNGKSNKELEVLRYIQELYNGNIRTNVKDLISNEIDILIPDIKLAIEFNGLYWHSDLYKDKKYHLNKSVECEKKGIQLFHIWEDDWDYKKDIVKSILKNKLGQSEKIHARKCTIREVTDNKLIKKFLSDNHIQGFVGSRIKIGLFYNDTLVSLMTFGSLRKSLGHKASDNNWEMLRFCNRLDTTVIGGASRLLKFFIKNYNPNYIMSYSDSSRGKGKLYEVLNFKLSHQTSPNYYWIIDGIKNHRFNWRKDKLVKLGYDKDKTEKKIMNEMGYYRIFDCGSCKWELYLTT
jgi:hypothetical protein